MVNCNSSYGPICCTWSDSHSENNSPRYASTGKTNRNWMNLVLVRMRASIFCLVRWVLFSSFLHWFVHKWSVPVHCYHECCMFCLENWNIISFRFGKFSKTQNYKNKMTHALGTTIRSTAYFAICRLIPQVGHVKNRLEWCYTFTQITPSSW